MDAYRESCVERWKAPHPEIKIIYDGTPRGAGIRRFIVDFYTKTEGDQWAEIVQRLAADSGNHPDFMTELAMQLFVVRDADPDPRQKKSVWKKVDACLYHDHVDCV